MHSRVVGGVHARAKSRRCTVSPANRFERAKQCAAMAYHGPLSSPLPLPRARGTSSRENERGAGATSDSIELFHPIGPVLLPSGGGISGAREGQRERWGGERNAEKTTRTRTKGRKKEEQEENHSTFYTSGYCIRIYYNLRIPEESDSGREGLGGKGRGDTVSRVDGREIDEEDRCS